MAGANMTKVIDDLGTWNWTASDKISMSIVEKLAEGRSDSQGSQKGDGQRNPSDFVMVHVRIAIFSRREYGGSHSTMPKGRIEFIDSSNAEEIRFDFEGIHFLKNGSVYGFAEPAEYVCHPVVH